MSYFYLYLMSKVPLRFRISFFSGVKASETFSVKVKTRTSGGNDKDTGRTCKTPHRKPLGFFSEAKAPSAAAPSSSYIILCKQLKVLL